MAYHQSVTGDDVAVLQYTGGTNGRGPKGAMADPCQPDREHGTDHGTGRGGWKRAARFGADRPAALPHLRLHGEPAGGFTGWGARNVPDPEPARRCRTSKRAFENYKITWMSGVNTLFNGLMNEVWFQDTPPRHLKFASAGGMALQSTVAQRWEAMTGRPLLQGYGLTETSPVLTFNLLGKTREGSIGVPLPSTEIRCLDDAGQPVPQGAPGEIAAKGPQVMKGYWQKPEETAQAMLGDWFLTGDIGVIDPDGYIRIVDRKKDMIVVSGFNVYPTRWRMCWPPIPACSRSR